MKSWMCATLLPFTFVWLATLAACGRSMPQYQKYGQNRTDTKTEPSTSGDAEKGLPPSEPGQPPVATKDPEPLPVARKEEPGAVTASGTVAILLNLVPPNPAGTYRNRGHIRSIWLTDANNFYLKTIEAYAGVRSVHLKRWQNFTRNAPDGVSGATQTTAAAGMPISATWDLKDKQGVPLKTGTYKLWMEFSETNTPPLDTGKTPSDPMQAIDATAGYEYLVVPFVIGTQASSSSESNNPVFKNVSIRHSP